MIKYKSTRGSLAEKTAAQAVIKGIAEDRGLYVPDFVPALPFELSDMIGKPYKEIAKAVISSFFTDYTDEEMQARNLKRKTSFRSLMPAAHTFSSSIMERLRLSRIWRSPSSLTFSPQR